MGIRHTKDVLQRRLTLSAQQLHRNTAIRIPTEVTPAATAVEGICSGPAV
jgi:hypothetical protein